METSMIVANLLRGLARYSLLALGILVFLFALISGSEGYGGGISGILKNSPNALPWLILLILIFVAWRWELVGGILLTVVGIAMAIFFNTGPNFWWSTFIMTLLIPILGACFIVSWYLRSGQ